MCRKHGFSAFVGFGSGYPKIGSHEPERSDSTKTYNGKFSLRDENTGESIDLPEGTTIHTPEEQEVIKAAIAKREEYERQKKIANTFTNDLCGEFFWSLYETEQDYQPNVSDDMLAKIIYLLTYLDYRKNILVVRDSSTVPYRPMKKDDVKNVIRLHRCNFPRFWTALMSSGVITENERGELVVCDLFYRGKRDGRKTRGLSHIKMYSRAIRYVYENTEVRSHKYLSYLYRLIPYINLKYNVLCLNPLETSKYDIKPLTTKELCGLIGIEGTKHNEDRLIDRLFKLIFVDRNKDKLSVITIIKRIKNGEICQYITINPQFYAGFISQEEINDIMSEFVITKKGELPNGAS